MVSVTFTAGLTKIFAENPRLGFLSRAEFLEKQKLLPGAKIDDLNRLIFNERLDAIVCGMFLLLTAVILVESLRSWYGILSGSREAKVTETPFVMTQLRPEEV
jgi:carbon starvation protein